VNHDGGYGDDGSLFHNGRVSVTPDKRNVRFQPIADMGLVSLFDPKPTLANSDELAFARSWVCDGLGRKSLNYNAALWTRGVQRLNTIHQSRVWGTFSCVMILALT
jgi:hypothetical protein